MEHWVIPTWMFPDANYYLAELHLSMFGLFNFLVIFQFDFCQKCKETKNHLISRSLGLKPLAKSVRRRKHQSIPQQVFKNSNCGKSAEIAEVFRRN